MSQNENKHSNNSKHVNISRVRRAIDFWPELTGGEKRVAGVIADHFNSDDGYAFPSYRYLESVYGFSSATISAAVTKLHEGVMRIERPGANNRYLPDMVKVESILADLATKRAEWKEGKGKKGKKGASRGEAASRRSGASQGEAGASQDEAGASRGEAGVLREVKPNVQLNAQPNAQPECPASPTSGERGPDEDRPMPKWASHTQGVLAGDWTWDDREFQPAIDMHGFDDDELEDEIDHFIEHHQGERRHDWNPGWLKWIQAPKVHVRRRAIASDDRSLHTLHDDAPF